MHIPDGYLSPATCAAAYAVAAPCLAVASHRVSREVRGAAVPRLAMLSVASFLVMMVNVPVPGGTTAHAVGAVLIAVTMGIAPAMVAVAVALLFQALIFADGGVLTYGANVVNMAILMPLVGAGVYRLVAGASALTSRRRVVAAALGGYVASVVSGVATGAELGLQPLLFTAADGTPLYNPVPLAATVPAMGFIHAVVGGPAEAVVTGAAFAALARRGEVRTPAAAPAQASGGVRVLRHPGRVALGVLAALIAIAPLGLLAPGGAYGEWSTEELAAEHGFVPRGLAALASVWQHTPLPDYGLHGVNPVVAYWLSAVVGAAVIAAAVYGLARLGNAWAARRAG